MDTGTIVLGAGSILMWLVDRSERRRERERDGRDGRGGRAAPGVSSPRALPASTARALQPPTPPRPPAPPPPPPVTFTAEQAARFTEPAPNGGRRFIPRLAGAVPTWLGARGAQRVSLGELPGEAWLVVPLAPGMPVAEALIAERVSGGRSCLGSLSYALLPGGRPVATLLVFTTSEAARSMSAAPSDFAILAEPPIRLPSSEAATEVSTDVASAPAEKTATEKIAPPPAKERPRDVEEQRVDGLERVSFDEETTVLSRALLAEPSSSDLSPFAPPPAAHAERANGIAASREGAEPAPAKSREAE